MLTKRLINVIILLITIWSIGGALGTGNINDRATFKNKEIPLSEANGVVVDSIGNIYVGSDFFGVVQVYDKNGCYFNNFSVKSNAGLFYLGIDSLNNIEVYSVRGCLKTKYDHSGRKISQESLQRIDHTRDISQRSFTSKYGDKYYLAKWPYPHITKNSKTIVSQNIILKSLTALQCIIIAIIGFFSLVIINRRFIEKLFNFKLKSYWSD